MKSVLSMGLIAVAAAAPVKSDAVLRTALDALAAGQTPPAMTEDAARLLRTEMDLYLRDTLAKLGELTALYGMGSSDARPPFIYEGKSRRLDQFQAVYARGWIQWRVYVRADGKIARLVPFSINAPGTD